MTVSAPSEAIAACRGRAREQLGRLEGLLDVALAQLAHTGAESPRWQQLRRALAAEVRLRTSAHDLPGPEDADGRRIAHTAQHWLRRAEPVLGLLDESLDAQLDNRRLFLAVRACADAWRATLRATRAGLSRQPPARIARWAGLDLGFGLGCLPEALADDALGPEPLFDDDIRNMLDDADQWFDAQGGRFAATLGLARLAEAALLARHIDPGMDLVALFGRYAGSPKLHGIADLRPDHILAFDAVYARNAPTPDPSLQLTAHQLGPTRFDALQRFFEPRLSLAAHLRVALPDRAFEALDLRIGEDRMREVGAAFDWPSLHDWLGRLGPEPFARAVVHAGVSAVAELTRQVDDGDVVQAILSAFEPLGLGLGAVVKTVPAPRLLELAETIGDEDLPRHLAALGADGLKHVIDCVGVSGTIIVLSGRPSPAFLAQLRLDLGRRSVRLTLQAAPSDDVARLLRRGLPAAQLRALIVGADRYQPPLGAHVVRHLAALPGGDSQLLSRIATLSRAMQWE